MLSQIAPFLAPMLLGAQLILLVVLVKGDICPGQRGRIHKVFSLVGLVWLLVAINYPVALVCSLLTLYFCARAKFSKTRDKGPLWSLVLASVLAAVFVLAKAFQQTTITNGLLFIVLVMLLGTAFAHLLLTIARTRLQAFHKILPFSGVVASIVLVILTLIYAFGLLHTAQEPMVSRAIIGLMLLVVGVLVWCAHIIFSKAPISGCC